ncbi:hypothetical protein [Streptomyces sp. NPDC057438]|uniref:hypothetical protein n=1 Tax=Streptomyces sp. NPDC057438 TaxID=3346133 RepID=UPI003681E868
MVVGSGIQAAALSRDAGGPTARQLDGHGLRPAVLIALLGPVSGAYFNPAVTLAARFTGRRSGDGLSRGMSPHTFLRRSRGRSPARSWPMPCSPSPC